MAVGDITIVNVNYPATLLPGEQTDIVVDVEFKVAHYGWYCRIYDNDLIGSIPFFDHEEASLTPYPVGSFDSAVMQMRPRFVMPDKPFWNLRIEIGVLNWLGHKIGATDWEYITIYPGTLPPITCPEGQYYDPAVGECVPYAGGVDIVTWILLGGAVVLLVAGVVGPLLKKKGV